MTDPARNTSGRRALAAWLRKYRYPVSKFASECGVSRQAVSGWLNGQNRPVVDSLRNLRAKIETLTGGVVLATAWLTPAEARKVEPAPVALR